ncbi:MAG: serine/threonine-protein kinase [Candidatus Aenigmatarchaeota archaeon]
MAEEDDVIILPYDRDEPNPRIAGLPTMRLHQEDSGKVSDKGSGITKRLSGMLATTDRYRLESKLGEGGFGKVYKAYDKLLKRSVAVKLVEAGSEDAADRALREARVLAQLTHQSIPRIYDFMLMDIKGKTHFVLIEDFIDGKTVKKIIKSRLRGERWAEYYTSSKMLDIIYDSAKALGYAHKRGILHRDIKPDNIMIADEGTFVLDFGLGIAKGWREHAAVADAKNANDDAKPPGTTILTQDGFTIGTPYYMSPEQAEGEREDVDERSDIYSLGATFYEMLTGKLPFDGVTSADVLRKVVQGDLIRPTQHYADVPLSLELIVLKAMARDKRDRFQSVDELLKELDSFRGGIPGFMERQIDELIAKGEHAEAMKMIRHGVESYQAAIARQKSAGRPAFYESLKLADLHRKAAAIHWKEKDDREMEKELKAALAASAEPAAWFLRARIHDIAQTAKVYESRGEFGEALRRIDCALQEAARMEDPKAEGWLLLVKRDILSAQANKAPAGEALRSMIAACREAYRKYKAAEDTGGMANALYLMCDVLSELNPRKCLRYVRLAKKAFGDEAALKFDLVKGKAYTRMTRWEEAIESLERAYQRGKELKDNWIVGACAYNLGVCCHFTGKAEESKRFMDEAAALGLGDFVAKFRQNPTNKAYEL